MTKMSAKGRAIAAAMTTLVVFGAVAVVLSFAPGTKAQATPKLRYSALLLHESQVFDQGWEDKNGTVQFFNGIRHRTHSWVFTEVVVQNPNDLPVPFCWRVTQASLIGTPDCTGTIAPHGVITFDSYQLEASGKLVAPNGILEIETDQSVGELVVWQHHNKHSRGEVVYADATFMYYAYANATINGTTQNNVLPHTMTGGPNVPPIGSGVGISVERVQPLLIQ